MKISYNWLKEYLNFDLSAQEVAEILTDTGLEVEGVEKIETIKGGLSGVVTGHVLSKTPHQDADRLNVTTVDVGTGEPLQIVCGAPNVEAGQKVMVATVGSILYPDPESPLKIKKSKIRGVESYGMICAEDELGTGNSHEGILVLDQNTAVGVPAKQYFNIVDDFLIEIGLTPNRADAMGHIGVSRDLKAYLNYHKKAELKLNLPTTSIPDSPIANIDIKLANSESVPRYAGAIISNIKVQESPDWLKNRLRAIGLNPINNIVDITNFVMHEWGNPLHAFDLEKVGKAINVRNARAGEKLVTLDEVERTLYAEDLVIANEDKPMCIAGVFGGIDSGVSINTTSIFLEAAYFNPVVIRQGAKRHGLNTDSSFRFERGIDPNTVIHARNRAINLILDLTGGQLSGTVDQYPIKKEDFEVIFNFDRCRRLIGVDISDEDILSILNELDIKMISDSEEDVVLKVPAYRVDVQREADIIEEVLRIFGFNQVPLPEKLNSSITFQPPINREKIYNLTANLLVDNGYSEIMNNSLTNGNIWDKIKSDQYIAKHDVSILNPLSIELDVMRQTLLFGGLKSIEYNQNRQQPNLKFFEFGSVYQLVDKKYIEEKRLGIWLTGLAQEENWANNNDSSNFYHLKGIAESILSKLGLTSALREIALGNDLLQDGYGIMIANKNIGNLGWVRPEILSVFGIKQTVFYLDLNWDLILSMSKINKIQFKPIPKTQFVRRDFSLLLDEQVTFESIKKIATQVDKKILKSVGLFDVYEGKNLDKGKKSYAVSFQFQDSEKTLKDQQIDKIMSSIRVKLENELGATLR